jgi:Flp pilus assembly protein TadD
MLRERGGEIARITYEERSALWDQYAWWRPFDRATLNTLGYSLLDEGRVADAVIAFELNAARFPDDWRVWDSLGDGYAEAGRAADAVRCFERALTIAPDNPNSEYQRRMIAELGGSVPP